MAVRD